jgi:putative restriction endonuclease
MQMQEEERAAGPRAPVRYWWVNHNHTFRQEIDGNYLWSPKKNRNGAPNASYDNMVRAVPGDIVYSYADGRIGAVGVVIDRVRTAPTPAEFTPPAQRPRIESGWLLPVRFETLPQALQPKDHMTQLAKVLPARHSPLHKSGDRNQSVYLAEIPPKMAVALQDLLGGQLQKIKEEIAIETNERLTDSAIEEEIWQRTDLGPREKRELINARIGQGIFRANVERIEKACRVTGVPDRRYLCASHIKPWRLSDDREKLDGFNGLLLSPHIGHLFARGHISFADDGQMLISAHLNPYVTRAWGLDRTRPLGSFRPEQCAYLDFHRRHVFEKRSGGRRS